jgi:hypothetical protein
MAAKTYEQLASKNINHGSVSLGPFKMEIIFIQPDAADDLTSAAVIPLKHVTRPLGAFVAPGQSGGSPTLDFGSSGPFMVSLVSGLQGQDERPAQLTGQALADLENGGQYIFVAIGF